MVISNTVSVLIPTYNAGEFVAAAVESVIASSPASTEIIVVDDGSTDDTREQLRRFGERIVYVHQANSGGPSMPRNRAIGLARGEYLFFLDSDDVFLPGIIESALAVFAQHPGLGLVFTDCKRIDVHGDVLNESFLSRFPTLAALHAKPEDHHIITHTEAHRRLAHENYLSASGVAVPRWLFERVGLFNPKFFSGQDWDMWLRVTERFDIAYIPRSLHCYRARPSSISFSGQLRRTESQMSVARSHMDKSDDPAFRAECQRFICECAFSLAYYHYRAGDSAKAREMLDVAAPGTPASRVLAMRLKLALGARLAGWLRTLKGRSTSA